MLVLSRKKEESIIIGSANIIEDRARLSEAITVNIIDIQGDRIRIGITAPKCYRILRNEVLDRILPPEPKS